MNTIFFFVRKNAALMTLSGLLGIAGGTVNALVISLIGKQLAQGGQTMVISLAYYAALVGVMLVTGIVSQLVILWLAEKMIADLRMSLCRQILDMPLRNLEGTGAPRLIASFTEDLMHIAEALIQIPNIFINASITIGCLIYLGFLSPPIFVCLLVFLLLSVTSYLLPDRIGQRYIKAFRERLDTLHHHFDALTSGIKELKLHRARRNDFLDRDLAPAVEDLRSNMVRFRGFYAMLMEWVQLLYFIFIGGLFVGFVYLDTWFQAGAIAVFAVVVLYIRTPVTQIMQIIPLLQEVGVGMEKIRSMGLDLADPAFDDRERDLELDRAIAAKPSLQCIRMEGITHTYFNERKDEQFTLGPIDLDIPAGELLFLVGGNGSGKTTLAKMITSLYQPISGTLYYNDVAVTDENREVYRQYFSTVFSDFHLFDENHGLQSADSDERARAYLEDLHLDHKVSVEDGKISTTKLSTGQRKRLALLAAYLEDREVYLFDEWASDQDPEFKVVFYHRILPDLKARGKTVIVISHDDRYFDMADRIVKLTDGQLQEISETVAQR